VRRIVTPLAQIQVFAVKERSAFLGLAASTLVLRLGDAGGASRTRATSFDPRAPACQALLVALRARIPAADATTGDWAAAAARLGITARPWYEVFSQPRVAIGVALLGAGAFANTHPPATRNAGERLGAGLFGVTVMVAAIWLIVSGVRRARAQQPPRS
jgi:hypothetical protein